MSDSDDGARGGLGIGFGGGKRRKKRGFDDAGSDSSGAFRVGLGGGGRRRGRQGDESVLGVFADASTPGERRGGKGKGKRQETGGVGGAALSKGVSFVRGETVKPVDIPKQKTSTSSSQGKKKEGKADGGEEASSESEVDERFKFDGAPNAPPPVEQGPKLPARNKLSFGQMSNSYGKGFSMLQKMGFSGGGLGRHNDGIANPIEVLKRKERMGLQEEGEKVGQDLYGQEAAGGKLSVEELLGGGGKRKGNDGPQPSEGWKREKGAEKKRPRIEYKTAAQLASEKPPSMRIVDMRGPEVKIATSFTELAVALSNDPVTSLRELRYNTRKLVAKYEDKIRTLGERKRYYEDVLLTVASEGDRLNTAQSLGLRGTRRCRELAEELDALKEQQARGELGLRDLGAAISKLKDERPDEFKALRVADIALALAAPAATAELAAWKPLERPEEGFKPFDIWADLSASCASSPATGSTASAPGEGPGRAPEGGGPMLRGLVDAALLPRLRAAVAEWPVRSPEPCLRLVERCREAMPREVADEVAAQLVLPRLRAEIDAWDPRVDRASPHLWVHPWLTVLGKRLDVLWAPIRFKLSACLERWNPSDRSALEVLRPWRLVFDPSNWEPLIGKILGRLERAIADMKVRPDGQDVSPVEDLAAWLGVAPVSDLARVLEAALFPQWHKALLSWLRSPSCDFSEVLQWYQGWKALLPEELREEPSVQRQLSRGLEVMKQVMSGGGADEDLPGEPAPSSRTNGSASAADAAAAAAAAVAAAGEEVSMSLSDYLAEVAGEEGIVFKPKKALHNGKQVYQFGATSICLERNLVYAAPKGGSADGEWRIVDMDEVLSLAKAPPPGVQKR